jgi:hypothetical protein
VLESIYKDTALGDVAADGKKILLCISYENVMILLEIN